MIYKIYEITFREVENVSLCKGSLLCSFAIYFIENY